MAKAKKNRYRWGMTDFSKPFPKIYKFMFILGLICLVLSFVLAGAEVLSDFAPSENMDVVIGFMALYGIIAPISVGLNFIIWKIGNSAYNRKEKKLAQQRAAEEEAKRAFEESHPHYEQEKFYLLCKGQGITSIDTPAAVARMVLLARNNNFPGSEAELIDAYKTGMEDVARNEHKERVAALQKEENKLNRDNLRYKDAQAQQKRVSMCQDWANHYRREEEGYWAQSRATKDAILNSAVGAMQKETDWATHGGIASGIAGPAAGLAVAMDIQRKNAGIREQNAQLSQLAAQAAYHATSGTDSLAIEASHKAEEWEKRAQEAANKLVQNLPQDQLLERLSPSGSATNSETGAVLVKVSIRRTENLNIYESVPAVVDGVLAAAVMADDQLIGTAYLPLPWDGAAYNATLSGICPDPVRQAKNYKVVVSPYRLWAIEK